MRALSRAAEMSQALITERRRSGTTQQLAPIRAATGQRADAVKKATLGLVVALQLPDPYVPEPHGIAMGLEHERTFVPLR